MGADEHIYCKKSDENLLKDHRGIGMRVVGDSRPSVMLAKKTKGITDSTELTNFTDRALTRTPPLATSPDESCSMTSGCIRRSPKAANAMGVLLSKISSRLVEHGALPSEERSVESV